MVVDFMKEDLKCVSMKHGVLSVLTVGIKLILRWSVIN